MTFPIAIHKCMSAARRAPQIAANSNQMGSRFARGGARNDSREIILPRHFVVAQERLDSLRASNGSSAAPSVSNDAITSAMVTHSNEIEITTPGALLASYQ